MTGAPRIETIGPELELPLPRQVRLRPLPKILIAGVVLFFLGTTAAVIDQQRREANVWSELRIHGVDTLGHTTRRFTRSRRSGSSYFVNYMYEVDGGRYAGQVESSSLYRSFKQGQKIWVVYLPHRPSISRAGRKQWIPADYRARVHQRSWRLGAVLLIGGAILLYRIWADYRRRLDLASVGTPLLATVVSSFRFPARLEVAFEGLRGPERRSIRCTWLVASRTAAGSRVVVLLDAAGDVALYSQVRQSVALEEPKIEMNRTWSWS